MKSLELPTADSATEAAELPTYTHEEALQGATEYFNGDTLAAGVWVNKYALKDSFGNIYERNPDEMHRRIAREIVRMDNRYPNPLSEEEVYQLLRNFRYLVPQGSPMAGIGNPFQVVSLSNCFVIGVEGSADSYGAILKMDEEQVQLMKRRGGVGHDLSHLRPSGTPVMNSALTSTGILPFMERYSNSTREVAQDGRRGALMLTLAVQHPDAPYFVDAKVDNTKVTGANISLRIDDEFMKAALAGAPYMLRFPVGSKKPAVTREIDAADLWKKIVHNAWKSAEPGVLFWDTVLRESVPDCYADLGFRTVSTNPCLTGGTLVAVADGRGHIPIKQLAAEGRDVPVYCLNANGRLEVQIMRNPRLTGKGQKIYKLTLDDGSTIRATANHKFRLKNGEYRALKDLKPGDSLMILTKFQGPVVNETGKKQTDYWWLNEGAVRANQAEHRLIAAFSHKKNIRQGEVIHHIDYNGLNNRPENLEIMSVEAHNALHQADKLGLQNPMFKIKADPLKFLQYSQRMSASTPGFRKEAFGSIRELSLLAAQQLNFMHFKEDPRLVRTLKRAQEQGYEASIHRCEVMVKKVCEHCGKIFLANYHRREISFCSQACSTIQFNTAASIRIKRTQSVQQTYQQKAGTNKTRQLDLFTRLQYELGRIPKMEEWEALCKQEGVPVRTRTKYGFPSYEALKSEAAFFNHRIQSIEFDGFEDVYNGTVDQHHNFFAGGWSSQTKDGKEKIIYLNQLNCGEIPLCPYDSCRLLAINLFSYVEKPFTAEAHFDFERLKKHAQLAQRVMDDIIDLELEKIEHILVKIDKDPEPEPVKATERDLWLKIREKCRQGRRTGIGITAEGDMLAALGIRYGSEESLDFCENLHRTLALAVYRGSVELARQRGAFPVFDAQREENNPFISRLREADPVLYADMAQYGRRNIALLTIAPTGTTSLMTQTTSGLEPVFRISYKRRRKVNPNDKNAHVTFTDAVGDSWEDYHVFHYPFRQWLEAKGYDPEKVDKMPEAELDHIIEQSPWYRATAEDVDWVNKVHLQGRVQKWVDHSISVTVNVPEEATEELIEKIYLTGWEAGCKGMTVYREGSRSGVLVSDKKKDEKNETFTETAAPKRPKVLDAVVVNFMNNEERWVAVVGLYDGHPYEIFTGRAVDSFSILTQVSEGKVIKVKENGKNRYDFQYMDNSGYKVTIEGLSRTFNKEYWNYARLISGILRHGMPLPYVVEVVDNLHLETASLNNWKNGVVRALRKFIPDGTEPSHNTCPSCNTDNLVYQEGCLHCKNCGHSECN
ncbi:MAG: HNH endonuclease [Saprospirales bacterium]|nr:HNH endonuclease [Saprospirales bacterium]MBK8923889.1 HNH endonuclease [Saprospirales bacterium]